MELYKRSNSEAPIVPIIQVQKKEQGLKKQNIVEIENRIKLWKFSEVGKQKLRSYRPMEDIK